MVVKRRSERKRPSENLPVSARGEGTGRPRFASCLGSRPRVGRCVRVRRTCAFPKGGWWIGGRGPAHALPHAPPRRRCPPIDGPAAWCSAAACGALRITHCICSVPPSQRVVRRPHTYRRRRRRPCGIRASESREFYFIPIRYFLFCPSRCLYRPNDVKYYREMTY